MQPCDVLSIAMVEDNTCMSPHLPLSEQAVQHALGQLRPPTPQPRQRYEQRHKLGACLLTQIYTCCCICQQDACASPHTGLSRKMRRALGHSLPADLYDLSNVIVPVGGSSTSSTGGVAWTPVRIQLPSAVALVATHALVEQAAGAASAEVAEESSVIKLEQVCKKLLGCRARVREDRQALKCIANFPRSSLTADGQLTARCFMFKRVASGVVWSTYVNRDLNNVNSGAEMWGRGMWHPDFSLTCTSNMQPSKSHITEFLY